MPLPHRPGPSSPSEPLPEVYSAAELAEAAGVDVWMVKELIASADIGTVDGGLVSQEDAVEAVRGLNTGRLRVHASVARPGVFGGALLSRHTADRHSRGPAALVSTTLHGAVVLVFAILGTVSLTTASDSALAEPSRLARLVFLAEPGPGGGGGGGGLRMPAPPPRAERAGPNRLSSPTPDRIERRRIEPTRAPEPPRLLEHESLPKILAPLMAVGSDPLDRRGLLDTPAADRDPPERRVASHGAGIDGGVGTGGGTGIGPGRGAGVGPGTGGGTGGGPYRAGSGVTPPTLVYEEQPHYTEDARRRGITGDVLLEIVVLADGTVGRVRVLRRLGAGLDEEAVRAIRQWRFAPAERHGVPVDVAVEVAVEFKLR